MTNAQRMMRIERMNYVLGAVLVVVAAILRPRADSLGVLAGVILTCANFALLRRLVVRFTEDAKLGRGGNRGLLMLPKMVGLMVAVVLLLWLLPINAIAFAVGYSVFVVSIMIETVYGAFAPSSSSDSDHELPGNGQL